MNAKHTPGPWKVGSNKDRSWIGVCCDDDNAEAEICSISIESAQVEQEDGPAWDQCAADARLIAAAPDLLEACEAMVTSLRTFRNVPKEDQDWTSFDDAAIEAGFAALAKAKGE